MADQIQQLKYQWDPELIWCPIKFFDIAIQQLNGLVSRGKKQLSWVYLACWCFFFAFRTENLTKIIILRTASFFLFIIVTQAHGMPESNLAKKAA